MSNADASHKSLGFIGVVCGVLCEAAAALPFAAPEVIWLSSEHSLLFHLAAALFGGGGASLLVAGPRGVAQWAGLALFFTLLAFVLPLVGILTVLLLTLILLSHHSRITPRKVELVEVPGRREISAGDLPIHTAGPVPMPLVSMLDGLDAESLQSIVLGLADMPPVLTRPILHRLQKHRDVRVQLYANGLLNDQLDRIERHLVVLKERLAARPGDEESRIAMIETYRHLFANHLIASDEVAQTASQALQETAKALALNPSHPVALQATVEFHLLRGEFRDAAIGIEHLRPLPGQQRLAAALHARLLFDQAAAAEVPHSPAPLPPARQQPRSKQS